MLGPSSDNPRYESYRSVRVFSCLDGLRCLSILGVLWHHGVPWDRIQHIIPGARFGSLGVDLFFVISGFLIVTLLLRERDQRGAISLRAFYTRRALRIFPLYYGWLFAYFCLYTLRPQSPSAAPFMHDLPALAFYLTNWIKPHDSFAITWSLSTEEQFYLVWPALEKYASRHVEKILGAVLVASQLIQFGVIDPQLQHWFGWGPTEPDLLRTTTFTPICLGVLLAHSLHDPKRYGAIARLLSSRVWAPFWLVSFVVLCNFLPEHPQGWGRLSAHIVLCLLLASCVVREDNGLHKLLAWGPVAWVGKVSYGIYLLHVVCFAVVEKGLLAAGVDPLFLRFPLGVPLVLVMAGVSYRYYEGPFLRLKRGLQDRSAFRAASGAT